MSDKPEGTRKHPAKYTDSLMKPIFELLPKDAVKILDPFAGTGKIFKLNDFGRSFDIYAVEIEPEWACLDKRIILGDALELPFLDGGFDAVCTSPTYGNRMADSFNAADSSQRNTYHHALGRKPSKGSSATLQWGNDYRKFHIRAWLEVWRVLKSGGCFILNIKDHVRCGEIQDVSGWHLNLLTSEIGFDHVESVKVKVPSNRFGKNGTARIEHENLFKLRKPK